MALHEKAGALAARPASNFIQLGGVEELKNSHPDDLKQAAITVAACELHEAAEAIEAAAAHLLAYIEEGDRIGARRSLLMAETGMIRAKLAWRIFEEVAERRAA